MAVMAIVCVAVVLGGGMTLGPFGRLHLLAGDAEAENNPTVPIDAVVVYDEQGNAVALYANLVGRDALGRVGPSTFQALSSLFHDTFGADAGANGYPSDDDWIGGDVNQISFGPPAPNGDLTPPPTLTLNGSTFNLLGFNDWPVPPGTGGQVSDFARPNAPSPPPPPPVVGAPEPAAWTMMVFGAGAIGLALRRARRASRRDSGLKGDALRA